MPTQDPEPSSIPASDPASPDHAPIKTTTDARGGVTLGRMRWVLAASLAAVVIVFLVIWALSAHA
jgi:hypothetical protein